MSQSFTHMDAGTQPIRLTVELAEEVLDSLQWVADDWDNMDADDRLTHRGYLDAYNSILDQLPVHKDTQTIDKDTHTITIDTMTGMYHSKPKDDKDVPVYPEPEGCPSY